MVTQGIIAIRLGNGLLPAETAAGAGVAEGER